MAVKRDSASTSTKTQLFVQSVKTTLNNKTIEIPRSMMLSCLYVEHAGLTGPQLMISFKDSTNWITGYLGVKYGSIITVTLGDPNGNGKTQWSDTFFVLKAPSKGDVVTFYAFSQAVRLLKMPAVAAQFFVEKQPKAIISTLASGLSITADTFTKQGTYHLNVGQKPSAVLNEIARDDGAIVWSCRGGIFFRSLDKLANASASLTYEANNPKSENLLMTRWATINNDHHFLQQHQYRYMGYDMSGGLIESGSKDYPVKWVDAHDQSVLSNMSKCLLPKFEFECEGNGALTPGLVVKPLVHSYSSDSGLDETVPAKVIIRRVTHFEDRYSYTSKAECATVYNGS